MNRQTMKTSLLKAIPLLLITAVLLGAMLPLSVSAEEIQMEISGFDCSRDTGALVVYTDAYGESTGTNYWGAEAIVGSDNRVISLINGNAEIPEGGFVVSGHDDETPGGKLMKTWIYQNITVGDYVYADPRTSTLTVSDHPIAKKSPFFSFDNIADGMNMSRGTDMMILYTPEYGASTGTNEYGYEVTVENGVVTKLGGNNSPIPSNGYIVSLHGSTAKWMRLKIVKGMLAELDPDTLNVVFTYSAAGIEKAVEYSMECVQTAIDNAKTTFVYADIDTAAQALDTIRQSYQAVLDSYKKDGDDNAFADQCDALISKADTLSRTLCDSYPVQYRGAWIRPSQRTAAEVDAYVKELHDAGINFVCVEGWFENGVIFEVPEGSLFGKHRLFKYDALQAYIDACHKYGMECHLWMPILNVGSSIDSGYNENTVTGQKPEWLSLNNKNSPYNESGFMMIDPANEEACDYLLEFYRYIVTTYDIDCFEMDYIRYYVSSSEEDYGYTEAAFAGFEEAYKHGVTPTYDTEAAYWEDWCQYRRDCITRLVRDIRAMIDSEAPDMLLAADVAFPFDHALNKVYQDFPQWLEEGLLDVLHPMAYGDGYGEEICQAVELGGKQCMVVTGLGVHTDLLGAEEMERQAREDNSYGCFGDCYFEANTYLSDHVAPVVKDTVYRNDAMPIFLDVHASVNAMLDYMTGRIDNVIQPLGGMNDTEVSAVKNEIEALKAKIADGDITATDLAALQGSIDALGNENAKQVLTTDLSRVETVLNIQHKDLTSEQPTSDASLIQQIMSFIGNLFSVIGSFFASLF